MVQALGSHFYFGPYFSKFLIMIIVFFKTLSSFKFSNSLLKGYSSEITQNHSGTEEKRVSWELGDLSSGYSSTTYYVTLGK